MRAQYCFTSSLLAAKRDTFGFMTIETRQINKFIYSQLSSDSVRRLLIQHFDFDQPPQCRFYVLGLHDNYLIDGDNKKFILRIYRNDWRSAEQIGFELDLLSFLGKQQAPVAYPLPTIDNKLAFSIDCPEGKRLAALFPYADGNAPGKDITASQSMMLGSTVAQLHRVTASFSTHHQRPTLDLSYLLDDSIGAIAPFIDTENRNYLNSLQKRLHNAIPKIAKDQDTFGICIGDVNATNFHINDQDEITLFDFDQCGYGYRAFEIGKFNASISQTEIKHKVTKAFLEGYDQVRPLSRDEINAIPYFEIIALVWVMAIHAHNADRIGYKWLEQPFWNRYTSSVKKLDAEVFDG